MSNSAQIYILSGREFCADSVSVHIAGGSYGPGAVPYGPVGTRTAPSFHRFSVGWACGDGLRLGVDGIERHLASFRPERYQTPAHDGQFPLPSVGTAPDDRLKRLWRAVLGRRPEI